MRIFTVFKSNVVCAFIIHFCLPLSRLQKLCMKAAVAAANDDGRTCTLYTDQRTSKHTRQRNCIDESVFVDVVVVLCEPPFVFSLTKLHSNCLSLALLSLLFRFYLWLSRFLSVFIAPIVILSIYSVLFPRARASQVRFSFDFASWSATIWCFCCCFSRHDP